MSVRHSYKNEIADLNSKLRDAFLMIELDSALTDEDRQYLLAYMATRLGYRIREVQDHIKADRRPKLAVG